jgi:NADH:ubiquinone oxidoreductase subunit E
MKVTVCIGSSCHIKGSRQIVEKLNNLLERVALKTKLSLVALFAWPNASKV